MKCVPFEMNFFLMKFELRKTCFIVSSLKIKVSKENLFTMCYLYFYSHVIYGIQFWGFSFTYISVSIYKKMQLELCFPCRLRLFFHEQKISTNTCKFLLITLCFIKNTANLFNLSSNTKPNYYNPRL